MSKKYQVVVDKYSLNELTEKLSRTIYGEKVKATGNLVVPAFANLVKTEDPSVKGVTWDLNYKSQADKLAKELNTLLDNRLIKP